MDNRPAKERLAEFQLEFNKLLKKYDVIVIPVIERSPSADVAVIKLIDDRDAEVKKRFGIISSQPEQSPILSN